MNFVTVAARLNIRKVNIGLDRADEYCGMRKTLTGWSEYLGISYSTLEYREKRGIKPPELFDTTNLRNRSKI